MILIFFSQIICSSFDFYETPENESLWLKDELKQYEVLMLLIHNKSTFLRAAFEMNFLEFLNKNLSYCVKYNFTAAKMLNFCKNFRLLSKEEDKPMELTRLYKNDNIFPPVNEPSNEEECIKMQEEILRFFIDKKYEKFAFEDIDLFTEEGIKHIFYYEDGKPLHFKWDERGDLYEYAIPLNNLSYDAFYKQTTDILKSMKQITGNSIEIRVNTAILEFRPQFYADLYSRELKKFHGITALKLKTRHMSARDPNCKIIEFCAIS